VLAQAGSVFDALAGVISSRGVPVRLTLDAPVLGLLRPIERRKLRELCRRLGVTQSTAKVRADDVCDFSDDAFVRPRDERWRALFAEAAA
jgi:hypothetical protein